MGLTIINLVFIVFNAYYYCFCWFFKYYNMFISFCSGRFMSKQ